MFLDNNKDIMHLSGNLPHWRQCDVIYFVTFRLFDSLPQEKLQEWIKQKKEWEIIHQKPLSNEEIKEYKILFTLRMHKWFDNNYGSCILKIPKIKSIVECSLRKFENIRYLLDEFIVMPNHLHVLVVPINDFSLSEIMHSWKSFTAHEIIKNSEALNMLRKYKLNEKRKTNVWAKESFDHIIRNQDQLERVRNYIINNGHGY